MTLPDPRHFTNREEALATYDSLWLPGVQQRVLNIEGISGNGKTTLLWYLAHHHDRSDRLRLTLNFEQEHLWQSDHALLDALMGAFRPHLSGQTLRRYRRECARLDAERAKIRSSAVHADVDVTVEAGATLSQSPTHVDAEINLRLADHTRQARLALTDQLPRWLAALQQREIVLFCDTYEIVGQQADADFQDWFEGPLLDTLLAALPQLRVVLAGRQHLPFRADRNRKRTLRAWTEAESNVFLASYGLTEPALQAAIYRHCQGHPLVTDMAREVWQVGQTSGQPLKADQLLHDTNRQAATEWLFRRLVERLPAPYARAVEVIPLLRRLTREAVNAVLPEDNQLSRTQYNALLTYSFVQQAPGEKERVHDLVRQTADVYFRQEETAQYHAIQRLALDHYEALDPSRALIDILYHMLVTDPATALRRWVRELDARRLRYDHTGQNALLQLLHLPERWPFLPPAGRAECLFYEGILGVFQDRLAEAEQVYNQALPLYRQIEARLGEANTLKSLGQLRSAEGKLEEAEASFAAALTIYERIGDRYSTVATLTYRGQHRLNHEQPEGLADWGIALPLSVTVDPHLFRQVLGICWSDLRRHLRAARYELLAEGVGLFVATVEKITDDLTLDEQQAGTVALVDGAFRVVGALASHALTDDDTMRTQLATFARQTAAAIDAASGGGLQLVDLVTEQIGPE